MHHYVIIEDARPYLAFYDDSEEGRAMAERVLAECACDACEAKHARGMATPKHCRIERSSLNWNEFRRLTPSELRKLGRQYKDADDDDDDEKEDEDEG